MSETLISMLMDKRGLVVNRIAKEIGGNRVAIYEVVKGYRRASKPLMGKISKVLGVSEEEIFDERGMAKK